MYRVFLFSVLLSFSAPTLATESVVLIVGDSLSASYGVPRPQSWAALLERRLGDDCRVVNASISGDTTSSGRARLPRALSVHKPGVVIIGLGGNDGLRGYPLSEMRANLDAMIMATKHTGADVVLIGVTIPPNYGPDYRRGFEAVFEKLAAEHRVPLVRFAIEEVAGRPGMLQDDGVHPTAAAQPWMLDLVWEALHPLLKCSV